MQMHDLDKNPEGGAKPISNALLWLQTLINSEAVTWNPEQKVAAQKALDDARVAMTTELTVRQKDGGGFALDFRRIQAVEPRFPGLLTEDATGRRH